MSRHEVDGPVVATKGDRCEIQVWTYSFDECCEPTSIVNRLDTRVEALPPGVLDCRSGFWTRRARWRDWRLYRKYEKDRWQLFDLRSDPGEETDIAVKHADVVKQMASQHAAWSKTLAPLGKVPKIRAREPIIPSGHGWAFASAKDKGDTE